MKRKLGGETKREGRVSGKFGWKRTSVVLSSVARAVARVCKRKGEEEEGYFLARCYPRIILRVFNPERGCMGGSWMVSTKVSPSPTLSILVNSKVPRISSLPPSLFFPSPYFFKEIHAAHPIPLTHFVGREILRKISSKNSPNIRPNWNFKIFARIKVGQSAWIIYERLIWKSGMKRRKKRKIYVCFDFRSSFIDFFFFALSHIRQNTNRTSNFIYS